VADQIGSPTHTWDLAAGLVTLWEKGARGFFHLTDSGSVSWHGFAVEILKRAGIHGVTVEAISTDELDRPAPRPLYSVLDNSKYNAFSGRPLPSWDAALAHYFERRAARESS
jgi:dTDP-4-dehydrorhamnose reductase